MGVDYLRRLAIDSARSRGHRLVCIRCKLERTGLGVLGMTTRRCIVVVQVVKMCSCGWFVNAECVLLVFLIDLIERPREK